MSLRDPASRLLALLDEAEPRFRQRFINAVAFAKNKLTIKQIRAALETGREEDLYRVINKIGTSLSAEFNTTLILSADGTGQLLERSLGIVADFDQTNVRAVAQMAENRLRLVNGFAQAQRETSRNAMIRGIRDGANPREMARRFRDSIGLTPRQESAVANFERMLRQNDSESLTRALRDQRFDGSIRASLDGRKRLTEKQIRTMTERYRQRYIKYRSEVIARTEGLKAVHEGTEAMYAQAIEAGDLEASKLIRIWNVSRDGRERDSHSAMHLQEQPFGTPFVSGAGNLLRFPGDSSAPAEEIIQCRCALGTRLIA